PSGSPRFAFSETLHDFGQVQPTEKLHHDFLITNIGAAVLVIGDVTSSCACTTVGPWDRQIAPGKVGKIPLTLNPAAFPGTVTKSVAVFCNDSAHGPEFISMRATVWRPYSLVESPQPHFMPVEGEENRETKVVRIINNLEEPVTLEQPEVRNPNFQAKLRTV